MEHQAQLRSSLLFVFIAGFFGCNTPTPNNPVNIADIMLNKNETHLSIENGFVMFDSKPFSGTLFTLFAGTTDTAEIAGYLQGQEHGEWKKYYPSKKIRETRFFKNGQKTGEYTTWWQNGNKQMQYFFAADEYEGMCREWSESGMLNKVMNYKNGHEEGHQQWWYDNGKVKANYIIKDGRRYGLLGTKNCVNVSDSVFRN